MKINKLLNEIIKGQWLLDSQFVDSAAPYVHSFLTGGNLAMPPFSREEPSIQMLDDHGGVISDASEKKKDKVAVVSMIGPIHKYGDCCSNGAVDIVNMLDRANSDETVKGIVFIVDGPGGAVSAINSFVGFASRKKKPIVVLSDTACSLHYWTACAVGDHIMGENNISGRFGSVGVVCSFVDTKAHWEEKGYKFHEIYPSESSEKNKVFQLAMDGKYDRIKEEHLSPLAQKFQAAVRAARPNLKEETGVLTGATFETEKALELGMIDSIGNMQKAVEMVNVLSETYSM